MPSPESRGTSAWLGLLLVLIMVFCFAVTQLMLVRFTKGDVFPPYSSLRADPLGTKALADTIDLLPTVTMERHLLPFERLKEEPDRTLIFAGMQRYSLDRVPVPILTQFKKLVANRSRAILAYAPYSEATTSFGIMIEEAEKESRKAKEEDEGDHEGEDREDLRTKQVGTLDMSAELGVIVLETKREMPAVAELQADLDLPETLEWHSILAFKIVDTSAWTVVYSLDGQPVVIERKLGTGTIVLASDSYFLSNEAMRLARHPRLLAWLIGDSPTVLFDESHLGVNQNPGVASLARQYGLQGAFFGLVLLALLFVWRSTATFMPRKDDAVSLGFVNVERDQTSGLVTILRNHIKPKALIAHCIQEWETSSIAKRPAMSAKAKAIHQLNAEGSAPVSTYQRITALLNKRS